MSCDDARTIGLRLLQGFGLSVGQRPVSLITSAQRLLAFLALQERQVGRAHVAAALWPDTTAPRANASLRSAIWRAQRPCGPVIQASGAMLALSREVVVDVRLASAQARRLLDGGPVDRETELPSLRLYLSAEVLPDWYDDWVIVEREQFHQLRLYALEALCERLTSAGRVGEAVDVGLAAIRAEPLRESAHRVLIEAHLAAGNRWEALRQFKRCRALLDEELGLEPSTTLAHLVRQAGATVSPAGMVDQSKAPRSMQHPPSGRQTSLMPGRDPPVIGAGVPHRVEAPLTPHLGPDATRLRSRSS